MSAHLYTTDGPATGPCTVCGKTRNAKAHKEARLMALAAPAIEQVEADAAMEAEMDVECPPEDSDDFPAFDADADQAKADAITATDDAEIADALAALKVEAEELVKEDESWGIPPVPGFKPAEVTDAEVEAAKQAIRNVAKSPKGERTASIWVGWRITNAAVLTDTTLAAKLKAAKPTGDLDRTVKLTMEELRVLDGIAAKFTEPGHTGPEQYSGRALRGRIAAAVVKIETAEENSK